jgi:hypothetical protein
MGDRRVPKGAVTKMIARHGLEMTRVTFMGKRTWRVRKKGASTGEHYLASLWEVWRKFAKKEDADDFL